jgi:hypothetical protein
MKLTFDKTFYDSVINDLSRSASPIVSEQMAAGYGYATGVEDEVYLPLQDLGTTSQVMGIVVAFLEDAYQIVFKNGVWNRPGIFNMIKLGVMGFKMIKSILFLFKK